jgi:IS5 family transposase
VEDALIVVPTMRRCAKIDLISDKIPDEATILSFRYLLEKNNLLKDIFETVKALLSAQGMTMRLGTIVDASHLDLSSKFYPKNWCTVSRDAPNQ